ncbi:NAD-dependent epimerase/dehydratase family protein [Microcella sp.]|uniref:NAD-dependent epimerase/dehydratase family protein n=1 Tax=Microcella sp. TaxID=1913979 RepID=UPI00255E47A7|nr:NAD-dependent epimerase/dehydratase family protein [Microcella sp.]MBX9472731.1 NAD-dependent epimerase/dehydratase family protein [Microcella sp.]
MTLTDPSTEASRALGTVLLTGASGRLGRAVHAALEQRDDAQIVAVVSERAAAQHPSAIALDLADHDALAALVADHRPDTVLHLGAMVGAACQADPLTAIAVNVGSTRAIADALAEHSAARIVLASTVAVYGDAGDAPFAEAAPLVGQSAYARTKRGAEEVLEAGAVESVALRIANLWGPGFDDSLVARLQSATAGEPATVRGPAVFVRDYVHVDDVVAAVLAAATARLPQPHLVVNVGTGVATTTEHLIALLERHGPVHVEVGEGAPTWSVVDPTLLHAVLGVRARSVDELLR